LTVGRTPLGTRCHEERNRHREENRILFAFDSDRIGPTDAEIRRRERLGGLLNLDYRAAG
jgi:hypothetical protein